jgi:trehalose 6-phosphate phosphatase
VTALTERVRALVEAPGRILVVSDFDGTLAPIQLDPLGARILPLAQQALRRLARIAERRPERLTAVVLSGRAALDVAARVRVGGIDYHGNHGIEAGSLARGDRAERLRVTGDPDLQAFVPRAGSLGTAVATRLGNPGWLFVEDKGPTVAFHFRQAPDATVARAALLEAIAAVETELGDHGLVALEGRKVVEFRPLGAGGKGAAVARLIERLAPAAVLVMGDDTSDAEAFDVVRAAREAGRVEGLALAVHASRETPPGVVEAADLELPNPLAAARVLSLLARLIDAETRVTTGRDGEEPRRGGSLAG